MVERDLLRTVRPQPLTSHRPKNFTRPPLLTLKTCRSLDVGQQHLKNSQASHRGIRDCNCNTSPALKRPDYSFLSKNKRVFRGEERGSEPAGDPERELVDKLRWIYDPLPYFLGLLWILLSLKAFLCICDRISRNCHERRICGNY